MIQIKYGNNVLFEVLETPSCERVIELMSADHVRLSWVSREGDAIPAGAYITYKGETFTLLDAYKPVQKSENEFEYAPEFGSSIMAWGKVPFFFHTVDSQGRILSREMDWSLTGGAGVFLDRICDAIEKETGETYTYSADESLPGSKNRQFSSVDILSALNDIANTFETEWWVDKANKVIHLSKCEVGTAKALTVGGNVRTPSVQMNSEGFFNRYYAFGSTRNIVQSYTGANVNNLVNKRLTLDPEEYPDGYYEPNPIPSGGKVFSKILVFDDIYPAATNFVAYDILSRQEYVLDEATGKRIQIGTDDDGNPIYDMYAVYYIKIGTKSGSSYTQYTINPWEYSEKEDRQEGPQPGREGQLLPGLNVSVHFDSGSLRGREFEVRYVKTQETYSDGGTPIIVTPGYFEIKYVKDGNYIIPDITSLFPKADDKVILFNLRMPDEYIEDAYGRLEEKMLKTIEEKFDTDLNLYTVESNPIAFEEEDPGLGIGSRVTLINGDYSLSTRVTKLTSRLDFPYVQSITVGNSLVKGTIQELKEEVVNANTSLEIIATLNSTAKAIADSYTRTQQVMIENFNKISDMFELDETSVAGKIFIRAKYDGLYSDGEISAGGAGTGGGETAGIDRIFFGTQKYQAEEGSLAINIPLTGTNGIKGVLGITALEQAIIDAGKIDDVKVDGVSVVTDRIANISLSGYATENWVLGKSYITSSALTPYRTSANQDTIDNAIKGRLTAIEGLIPSAATTSNLLADKSFVNSSIATATATFRGTSASGLTEAQFLAWANGLTKDNNDYVFWNTVDANGNVQFKRYKYNGTSWVYEYTLNNSSFTAAQWAAINSGLTSSDKTALDNALATIGGYGNIVTHNVSEFATAAQGAKADSALQAHQIYALTLQKNGTAIGTYTPNSAAKTINIADVASAATLADFKTLFESMFERVGSGTASSPYKIHAKYGFYSDYEVSAGGDGTGGGGGGLIEDVYGYTDLGGTYSDSVKTDTFNAYTIARLASRITSLEERPQGGVTSFNSRTGAVVLTAADVNAVISYQAPITASSKLSASLVSGLATVATSGAYGDLSGKPTALKNPYALSWSGYSSGSYDGSEAKSLTIPSNTNQLTNGAGFITGINSSMVVTALGYTPANATALSGYLPLSGGTMTGNIIIGDHAISVGVGTSTSWNDLARGRGLQVFNTVGATSAGAPARSAVGLYVQGYYGFQLACKSGENDFVMRSTSNAVAANVKDWVTLYHSGNANNTSTPWSASSLTLNGAISGATNIYASGNVGIGTTSPDTKLHVSGGTLRVTNNTLSITIGATNSSFGHFMLSGGIFYFNRAMRVDGNLTIQGGDITATGEISAGSDRRWKHGIAPVADGLSAILRLQPSEWTWNSDNHKGSGLIAQDVQSVLPHLVKTDGNGYLHLAYDGFHAYEISAIQQLNNRIKELEKEIQTLKQS